MPDALILIILVTAKSDPKDVVAALEAGGDEYLTKPVDHASLVARVKSMLRIKSLHDQVQEQAAQLQEWNRTLEQRVADQLAQMERLGRLKRFFSPQLAERSSPGRTIRSRATGARSRWCFWICAGSPRLRKPPSPRRSWRCCASTTPRWDR
jgi:response regulator RpfG family c-di-GMP phosphodiesterase